MSAEQKVETSPKLVSQAYEALNALNPDDLTRVLRLISQEYRVCAVELREAWQDKVAGKVWDIAATGLESTADNVQKYWDSL